MWIPAIVLFTLFSFALSKKGKNAVKFTRILYETLLQSFTRRNKFVLKSYNNLTLFNFDEIVHIIAKPSKQYYDIICFHTNTKNELQKEVTHNHNPNQYIDNVIPITYFKHNAQVCSVPFRPSDAGHDQLFVSVKHLNQDVYSTYMFEKDKYINFHDITERYEKDIKEVKEPVVLAEAFDE
jgi:hypothetical protein